MVEKLWLRRGAYDRPLNQTVRLRRGTLTRWIWKSNGQDENKIHIELAFSYRYYLRFFSFASQLDINTRPDMPSSSRTLRT